MAWIRRVRTASGATAVQIAESVAGRRRIVAHVGSAHSEAELGVLLAQAEALLADPGQGALDLEVEPTPRAIEAHLTIVFTALALSREVQNRTGLAIRSVLRQLRPLRSATVTINGSQQTFPPAIPEEKQAILDAIRHDNVRH